MTDDKQVKPMDGGIAVGAYLRYLRDIQKLQIADLAEKMATDPSQLWRIEKWRSDTRSSLLFKYIHALGGDANDVALLINNPAATVADGEALAKLRFAFIKQRKK